MSRKNSIEALQPAVRQMIQRALYARGFQDYAGLAGELVAKGHAVSKSALHRYGRKLEALVKQAELDKLVSADGAGDGGQAEAFDAAQLDLLAALEGSAQP